MKISNLFIIVGPSGVGKTTALRTLMTKHPDRIFHPLTYTTRKQRPGESHGVDMFFIPETDWHSGHSHNSFCATGYINGHYYGTKTQDITNALKSGKRVVVLLDTNGTEEMLTHFPGAIVIALYPTHIDKLKEHLLKRWPDKGPLYEERVKGLQNEIRSIGRLELDYKIYSDSLAEICSGLEALIFPSYVPASNRAVDPKKIKRGIPVI